MNITIEFTKEVVVKSTGMHGKAVRTYTVGERCEAVKERDCYVVQSLGCIFFDEAEEVKSITQFIF